MPNFRIVACGGGNPTTNARSLFEAGLDLTGVEKPRILLIPTAKYTKDAFDGFVARMREAFAVQAGLPVQVLHEYGSMPLPNVVAEMLDWANLAYVADGNTRYMMDEWRINSVLDPIQDAVINGKIVACGFGAGALMHFTRVHSDFPSYEARPGEPWDYASTEGMGHLNSFAGVHLNGRHPLTGELRMESSREMIGQQRRGTIGVGLDNQTALEIVGEFARVIATADGGKVHCLESRGGGVANEHDAFDPSAGQIPLTYFSHL